MKKITQLLFLLALISGTLKAQVTVTVSYSGKDTINRHIYGHFAEHLGRCIYDGFYVGENNTKIPNQEGMRLDIINALKNLQIPNLRWPGGCFADTYHWKDGVGPRKQRPSMINVWWGNTTEDNSFGTHEFLRLCELLGTEPYISGNVGSGTVQELADWVKYVNHPNGSSPMPLWREKNGRSTPWQVTYWGIGNEAWGCGGNMTAEYYANVYRQYTTFISGIGGKPMVRIASGASSDDYHWTEVLMRDIPKHLLEGVALHHYSVIDWNKKSSATGFSAQEYLATMKQALRMEELIQKHAAIMDKYDPAKKVALVVDEWGGWYDVEPGTNSAFLFQQNTMRDAMVAGATLNIFNNHADRVRMANLAQTINVLQAVILTEGGKLVLTPTYHVMEMYKVHQDALLLPTGFNAPLVEGSRDSLPAISISASRNKAGKTHVSLTNIDPAKSHAMDIAIEGKSAWTSVAGRVLTSSNIHDHNTFSNPDKVRPSVFTGAKINGNRVTITLPAASVVVLELQ